MISPFEPESIARLGDEAAISFGTSSYGYDVRLAPTLLVASPVRCGVVDPKSLDRAAFEEVRAEKSYLIPPHGFALAHTLEYVRMPDDVTALVAAKSSYARVGLSVNFTVIEAGWEGEITLELANYTPLPLKVYVGEGIAQLLFFKGSEPCVTSYAARRGKYQGQRGVTLPFVRPLTPGT